MVMTDEDYALALQLQSHLFDEDDNDRPNGGRSSNDLDKPMSLVDPYWELTDPTPDMRALFLEFNENYFWGRLAGVEVKWSSRMTVCAGICRYEGRGGLCSIGLSVPLLKLRPRKDLIETLLHEMIHAYLFVTDNNKDHDGHGPEFHKHMYRLNKETGTNITVYHNFHDEVEVYKQHWWRCDGPCQNRKPYFGYVKRSMNRAPSKNDLWWAEHQRSCGGSYTKIKEPEGYGKKKTKSEKGETSSTDKAVKTGVKSMDIRIFGGEGKTLGKPTGSGSANIGANSGKVKSIPTATITSGVLSRKDTTDTKGRPPGDVKNKFNKDNIQAPGVDRKITSFLPGASTPTKPVKNKPVSQGGNVPFSKVKKKHPVINFSDSDDDDLFASVPSPLLNPGIPSDCDTGKSDQNDSRAANGLNHHENTLHNVQEEEIDSNDVRAMLRKVWGQKQAQQNKKLNIQDMKTSKHEVNTIPGQKREPVDSNIDINPTCKRIKLNSSSSESATHQDSFMSHNRYDSDGSSPSAVSSRVTEDTSKHYPTSHTSKVTSPIEKLFNKIKDRQKPDNQVPVRSVSDEILSQPTNCENSSTVISSNETHTDNDTSVCPVCNKSVPIASINDHLDLCLTLQAIA